MKEHFRIALPDIPFDVKAELKNAIAACKLVKHGRAPLDFILVFVKTTAELKEAFSRWAKRLQPAGMLWVAWPKKTSGLASDLDENQVRQLGLAAKLVDVKVCAVTDVWSGLKFVIRLKDRPQS